MALSLQRSLGISRAHAFKRPVPLSCLSMLDFFQLTDGQRNQACGIDKFKHRLRLLGERCDDSRPQRIEFGEIGHGVWRWPIDCRLDHDNFVQLVHKDDLPTVPA